MRQGGAMEAQDRVEPDEKWKRIRDPSAARYCTAVIGINPSRPLRILIFR